jgi:hypothetical protein
MIHPHTELRWINEDMGYGVFVTKPIPKGTIVWVRCALDIIKTPAEVVELGDAYKTIFGHFAYFDAEGNAILCWDIARYVNHSCQPAMMPVGEEAEIAVRDLYPGEHLTCDYAYCNIPLECHCGAPNCRGLIKSEFLFLDAKESVAKTAAAIRASTAVHQPLLPFSKHRKALDPYLKGSIELPEYSIFHCPGRA